MTGRERTRANRFQYRQRSADADNSDATVRAVTPIQISGKRTFGVKKLLVFRDADQIVLSIMTAQGTAAFPFSRSVTAKLVAGLSRELAEPPEPPEPAEPDDEPVRRRRRLGR